MNREKKCGWHKSSKRNYNDEGNRGSRWSMPEDGLWVDPRQQSPEGTRGCRGLWAPRRAMRPAVPSRSVAVVGGEGGGMTVLLKKCGINSFSKSGGNGELVGV